MGVDILNFVDPVRFNLLIAIVIFVLSVFLANIIASLLNKYFAKRSILGSTKFFSAKFVRIVLPFIGLFIAFRYIRMSFKAKNILEYEPTFVILENIIFILAIGFAAYIAFRGIVFIFHRYIVRAGDGTSVDANLTSLLSKVLKLVIFVIALIIVLDRFGVNINSFVVSLGIGSLAIALAAQETLANIIAGIVILVDRPFRIGDMIQLSNGNSGTVVQIGLRSCNIETFFGKMLIVPNTELTKGSLLNTSYNPGYYRIRFNFFVPYKINIDEIENKIIEKISTHEKILKEPAPFFIFSSFTQQSYELSFNCYCNFEYMGVEIEHDVKRTVLDALNDFQVGDKILPNFT